MFSPLKTICTISFYVNNTTMIVDMYLKNRLMLLLQMVLV
jgi:hypothetical protein